MDSLLKIDLLRQALNSIVLGCDAQVELLLSAILADGHVLIQGAPGTGKTSLAKVAALSLDSFFKRIQFTPDMLPADILGYSVYNQAESKFTFHHGPIFCNILLADEINRTTPRVQSALLEAMNENQVTIDGETRILPPPFFVMATQNRHYSTGTFPLPESQLDRFLISFDMPKADFEVRKNILLLHKSGQDLFSNIDMIIEKDELLELRGIVKQVDIADNLLSYISRLSEATHDAKSLLYGVSQRASIALLKASQALAFLNDREFIYPDDIKQMMIPVFSHRISVKGSHRRSGTGVRHCLESILNKVPVP